MGIPHNFVKQVHSPELTGTVAAFVANVEGLCLLGRAPSRIVYETKRVSQAEAVAAFAELGHPLVPRSLPADKLLQVKKTAKRLLDRNPEDENIPDTERLIYAISPGADYDMVSDEVKPAYEMLMRTLIVMAWTAFEVLATDVWVEAVNHRPKSLARNAWAGHRAGGDDDSKDTASQDFGLDLLDEYGFDLSKSMGTMMWRKRRFDFNSLQGLAAAYREAFRVKHKDGRTAQLPQVKEWFSGESYGCLGLTEGIRHATVHRGGRADAAFLARVEGHPVFGQLKPKDPIPLDGMTVLECIRGAVKVGVALLLGVDKWLTANAN